MAPDRTTATAITQSFAQARQGGSNSVGADDVLLALATEPSLARDVLAHLDVTPQRIRDVSARQTQAAYERLGYTAEDDNANSNQKALSLGPGAHQVMGRAEGIALAWGLPRTEPEHWLLAIVYSDHIDALLDGLGTSAQAIVEELRRRGARVPDVDPPPYRPWRGRHHLDVSEADRGPLLALLGKRHPPDSEWRWAINYFPGDTDRRCRIHAEEGIDLPGLLAETKQDGST